MHVTTRGPGDGFDLLARVSRIPSSWAVLMAASTLLAVFAADRATGSAPVQHFYELAVIFAAVRFEIRGGAATALAATVLYHLANPRLLTFRYGEADLVQIALFMAVGLVTAKLAIDARRLHRLAMTDDLTGLHNLRSFEKELPRLLIAAEQPATPVALFVLDVDRLKSINDRYGHRSGGDAVRTVGQVIAAWSPPGAIACRYGGDEFVIAVPRCGRLEAMRFGDDLRRRVNGTSAVLAGLDFPAGALSVSVGIACREPGRTGLSPTAEVESETLFHQADVELYRAKAAGRNRTCCVDASRVSPS